MHEASARTLALSGRYLCFVLGQDLFATSVQVVSEIIEPPAIISIPSPFPEICGMTHLHNKVISVVDVRIFFGMQPSLFSKETCLIILESGSKTFGLLVDAVREIIDIDASNIDSPPPRLAEFQSRFVLGTTQIDNKTMTLVNLSYLVNR